MDSPYQRAAADLQPLAVEAQVAPMARCQHWPWPCRRHWPHYMGSLAMDSDGLLEEAMGGQAALAASAAVAPGLQNSYGTPL